MFILRLYVNIYLIFFYNIITYPIFPYISSKFNQKGSKSHLVNSKHY